MNPMNPHADGPLPVVVLSGKMGSGKDTIADMFTEWGFTKVALADPMKRFLVDLFGWTTQQLWGSSEERGYIDPRIGVSIRHVLQGLGTEWGRALHEDVWVRRCLEIIEVLRNDKDVSFLYEPESGLESSYRSSPTKPRLGVVVSDVRFKNELNSFREAGAFLVRVRSKIAPVSTHESETELDGVGDDRFDALVENDGSLEELRGNVAGIITTILAKTPGAGMANAFRIRTSGHAPGASPVSAGSEEPIQVATKGYRSQSGGTHSSVLDRLTPTERRALREALGEEAMDFMDDDGTLRQLMDQYDALAAERRTEGDLYLRAILADIHDLLADGNVQKMVDVGFPRNRILKFQKLIMEGDIK